MESSDRILEYQIECHYGDVNIVRMPPDAEGKVRRVVRAPSTTLGDIRTVKGVISFLPRQGPLTAQNMIDIADFMVKAP